MDSFQVTIQIYFLNPSADQEIDTKTFVLTYRAGFTLVRNDAESPKTQVEFTVLTVSDKELESVGCKYLGSGNVLTERYAFAVPLSEIWKTVRHRKIQTATFKNVLLQPRQTTDVQFATPGVTGSVSALTVGRNTWSDTGTASGTPASAAKTDSNSQKAGEQVSSGIAKLPLSVPMPLSPTQDAWSLLPLEQNPLQLSVPTGWTMEYRRSASSDFYSASPQVIGGFLAFYRWPAGGKPEDIPAEVRKMADGLSESEKEQSDGKMSEKYDLDSFAGGHCKGTYAAFRLSNTNANMVLTVFMMNLEGQVWHGQFSAQPSIGSRPSVLKTIRRKVDVYQGPTLTYEVDASAAPAGVLLRFGQAAEGN